MRTDPGRGRLVTGLAAFVVSLLVGGISAAVLSTSYRARVEDGARRDALVIGTSVAQMLAQQFEKAGRFGIPLKLLPGVEAHLTATLAGTPGIAQIILRGPDGREIRSATGDGPGIDSASAAVVVNGITVASVEVATNPAALSSAFAAVGVKAAVAVVIFAAFAALAAGLTVGLALDRSTARLTAALRRTADGDFEPDAGNGRAGRAHGAVGRAFRALAHGNRHVRERRAVFDAYAEELLEVDFDGSVRPDVERLRREVLGRPQDPHEPPHTARGA
ncbi:hypothetical protein [Xanthobacter agilis]|uniref:HAMP domain-containing protein n=1 Tax=Xanthobacter agilis TaxID=47492 RepID=A0ABU0LGL8_XANAG|nr:hypothetical protein [Xanthobacter agilis]MDQ0506289.1 hypothetical protein [Xanthobacter agilis]